MKLATKLLLLVLAALMCVGCFASCDGDDTTTTTTTTTTTGGPQGPQGPEVYRNKLLDDKTYDGKTCTIWYKGDGFGPGTSLYIEEPGVSAVDRASYKRLQTITERSGITISGIRSTNGGSAINTPDIGYLRDLFSADDPDNIPDIVMPGGYATSVLAGEGWFLDLGYDNPYIDLSMDCWQANVNDGLSICGTYYGVSGMSSINNIRNTSCVFFDNDALATIQVSTLDGTAAAGFEDADTLYQWARDGEWTFKKLLALAAAFAGEQGTVQIPGQLTAGDKYGLEYQGTSSYSIFMATGKKYVTGDPDNFNIPKLMIDDAETMTVLNWLVDNVATKPYLWTTPAVETAETTSFGLAHSCLFRVNNVSYMASYSALGATEGTDTGAFNFGILPMPKFDYEGKQQDSYYCAHNAWYSTLSCIPKNAADTDFSSFVLQLITEMGYYAWDEDITTIWDAYIIDGLQGRYAPNLQDEEMLDLVLMSAASDMGEFNVWAGINIANAVRGLYNSGDKSWATWAQGVRSSIDIAIQEMLIEMDLISYE